MYKLIGSPKTRAFRVMWMLEELGQRYDLDPVMPRDASLASLNPSMKVPVLIDDGNAIIDSVAICQYLADKHSQLTFPAGTVKRAQQDSFTQFTVDEVEGALWTAAKHTFALPAEHRVKEVKSSCKFEFDRAMGSLATRLGDNTFVMGDDFTVPDLLLGHCGGWAASAGWSIPDGIAGDYIARVRSRPAFLKAQAARDSAA